MSSYKNNVRLRLNSIWHNMKTRCTNPNYDKYKYYGGRGIKICDEWTNSYNEFAAWALLNGYNDNLTLERIDVNGDYTPDNCRWVTRKDQANNRSSNRMITYNGETKSLQLWAEQYNINYHTLSERLNAGWAIDKALKTKVSSRFRPRSITFNGETHGLAEWSRILGGTETTVGNRLARGWSIERALSTPIIKAVESNA